MRKFKPRALRLINRCGVLMVVGTDIQNDLWVCSAIKLHIICRQPIGSAAIAIFEPCKDQGSPEFNSYREVNTLRLGYRTIQFMLFRQLITVCSVIHTYLHPVNRTYNFLDVKVFGT
jgi:hypothetical protein